MCTHLRVRLARQDGVEDGAVAVVRVDVDIDDSPRGSLLPKKILPIDQLQGRLGQSY